MTSTKSKQSPARSSEPDLNNTVNNTVLVTDARIGDYVALFDLLAIGGRFSKHLEGGRQKFCRVREMTFELTEDSEGEQLYRRVE